jgi:hypothetical protein
MRAKAPSLPAVGRPQSLRYAGSASPQKSAAADGKGSHNPSGQVAKASGSQTDRTTIPLRLCAFARKIEF